MKKVLSFVLSAVMLIAMLSTVAFAAAPVITAQPQDANIKNGEDAVYTVVATGEDLTYQWCYIYGPDADTALPEGDEADWISDSDYFSGTNTATLTVHSTYATYNCEYDGDLYYCVVTNAEGSVVSDVAKYTVEHPDADGDGVCDICINGHPFIDVTNPEEWYYDAVQQCKLNGLFEGDQDGKFNPANGITRAEASIVLLRAMLGEIVIEELETMSDQDFEDALKGLRFEIAENEEVIRFSDVEGKWYERAALLMANVGFINGYEDGTFRGDQQITRQEIATIFYRIFLIEADGPDEELPKFDEPVDSYADQAEIADWAKESMEWARKTGLFRGDEKGNVNPTKTCTRAEYAQLLTRIMGA